MTNGRGRPVTLEDVARAAGVSRATASRAMLESGPATTPARARVRAVAQRMGFVPDPAARALAGGSGTRIVVAVLGTSAAVLDSPYVEQVAGSADGSFAQIQHPSACRCAIGHDGSSAPYPH